MNKFGRILGTVAILGSATLGVLGLTHLTSGSDVSGRTSGGIEYTLSRGAHITPDGRFHNSRIIDFKDGITAVDSFSDGYFGPFDITDTVGRRIISEGQNQQGYANMRIDTRLRTEVTSRLREVYTNNDLGSEVQE